MTRPSFVVIVLAGVVSAGIALAETAPEPKGPGGGMVGHAMSGPHAHGMMGGGEAMCGNVMPMMGMVGGPVSSCPMMLRNVDVRVEKRDDGVGLILTSKDPGTVRRLPEARRDHAADARARE